jgi:hypothetical protein
MTCGILNVYIYLLKANYLMACGTSKLYIIFLLINFLLFNLKLIKCQHMDKHKESRPKEVSR